MRQRPPRSVRVCPWCRYQASPPDSTVCTHCGHSLLFEPLDCECPLCVHVWELLEFVMASMPDTPVTLAVGHTIYGIRAGRPAASYAHGCFSENHDAIIV
jgi:hypothetical protein